MENYHIIVNGRSVSKLGSLMEICGNNSYLTSEGDGYVFRMTSDMLDKVKKLE